MVAFAHFAIPPDFFSLPSRSSTHSIQMVFLGLLSPQSPLIFVVVNMWISVALSALDHLTFSLSTMVLSEGGSKQIHNGEEMVVGQTGEPRLITYAWNPFMAKPFLNMVIPQYVQQGEYLNKEVILHGSESEYLWVMVVTLLEILPHVPSKIFLQSGSCIAKFCRVLRHIVILSVVDFFILYFVGCCLQLWGWRDHESEWNSVGMASAGTSCACTINGYSGASIRTWKCLLKMLNIHSMWFLNWECWRLYSSS